VKGVGLELTSARQFEEKGGDSAIIVDEPETPSYMKLVLSPDHPVAGMIILGHHPEEISAATAAVKNQVHVPDAWLDELRRGKWKILNGRGAPGE